MKSLSHLFNPDAEQAVLGCMVNFPKECCDTALSKLKPSDFAEDGLRRIFTVIGSEWAQGKEVEFSELTRALNDPSLWPALRDVTVSAGLPANLPFHIAEVKSASDRRRIYAMAEELKKRCLDGDELASVLAYDEKETEHVLTGWDSNGHTGAKPWDDYLSLVTAKQSEASTIMPTGYGNLDHALKLRGGQVVVIAAMQKHGKSTLAINVATKLWAQGYRGAICSLEMKLPDIQTIMASSLTGVPRDVLEERELSPERIATMFAKIEKAKTWPWTIHDPHRMTVREFAALCKEEARKGARFMVADYFQLFDLDADERPRERHLQLEEISRRFKQIALETGLLIFALSQLNTKAIEDGKTPRRPVLAHLRGTGAIAQDADTVLLMSEAIPDELPKNFLPMAGTTTILCEIAANRRGAKGDCLFYFDGRYGRFIEA